MIHDIKTNTKITNLEKKNQQITRISINIRVNQKFESKFHKTGIKTNNNNLIIVTKKKLNLKKKIKH